MRKLTHKQELVIEYLVSKYPHPVPVFLISARIKPGAKWTYASDTCQRLAKRGILRYVGKNHLGTSSTSMYYELNEENKEVVMFYILKYK